jgi:hypothetical protein
VTAPVPGSDEARGRGPAEALLLRGFAPLVLLLALLLAAILLAPSVAPERYVPVTRDGGSGHATEVGR